MGNCAAKPGVQGDGYPLPGETRVIKQGDKYCLLSSTVINLKEMNQIAHVTVEELRPEWPIRQTLS